jgi:adenylate kinase
MRRGPRLAVLGRQGAGKGTQCSLLASRLGVPHLSTGDLFRDEVAAGTPLGRRVSGFLEIGELVPDEVVLDVVTTALAAAPQGYLLDGFPRNLAQATALLGLAGDDALDVTVELVVPSAVVLPRLAARRVCGSCGEIYVTPEGGPEITTCRVCGGRVARRADDTKSAIRRRLAAYDEQTGPMLLWLADRGLLVSVDGVAEADVVHERVVTALHSRLAAVGLLDAPS